MEKKSALSAAAAARVEMALIKTVTDLKAPPYTKEDVLKLPATHGARESAKFYSALWKAKFA